MFPCISLQRFILRYQYGPKIASKLQHSSVHCSAYQFTVINQICIIKRFASVIAILYAIIAFFTLILVWLFIQITIIFFMSKVLVDQNVLRTFFFNFSACLLNDSKSNSQLLSLIYVYNVYQSSIFLKVEKINTCLGLINDLFQFKGRLEVS